MGHYCAANVCLGPKWTHVFLKEELVLVKFHSVAGKEEKDEVSLLEIGRLPEGRVRSSSFPSMTFEGTCPLCPTATTAAFPRHVRCTPPCMTDHCTHVPTHLIANLQMNMPMTAVPSSLQARLYTLTTFHLQISNVQW